MKNLVRGGVILSFIGLFVAFIYAQSETESVLSSANDSQLQLNNSISIFDNNIVSEEPAETEVSEIEQLVEQGQDPQDNKKIIEKTVSSKATGGASRGMFTATAYCLRGKTAMGHGVRKGLIAVDPRVLPLGSRINISGSHAGTYLVSDTGGKIKGKRLDIWMASCAEARRFGRRSVSVNFLGR
ncbi:MAG: 3D domain-containing protein [Acidobacteriota bacterium]